MKYLKIVILAFSITQVTYSQNINTNKLDNYFKILEIHDKFMGSIAIAKKGEIIYNKQIGFSDIKSKKKANTDTKYRIGSISKTFTATLIFKAIEEGKINLLQTIDKYFPNLTNSTKIRIVDLLNHRSGIHNFTDNKIEYLSYYTKPKDQTEMIKIIAKGGSDFTPDTKAKYSNSNYVLLSYILEKTYNKTYATILKNKITIPLNLTNTYFGADIILENNESYSYRYKKKWKKTNTTNSSISMGAGGIVSSPSDLILFSNALFNYKILSKESVEKMKTIKEKYGMGLFKIVYYEKDSFGHNGGIDGFTSVLRNFIDENYTFAITSNGNNYNMNSITTTIINSIFNKHYDLPNFQIYKPKSKELNQYIGVYSSDTFPLKISITKSKKSLLVQATGQKAFNLDAIEKHKFKFEPAGIIMEFNPIKNEMTIIQLGKTSVLTKE